MRSFDRIGPAFILAAAVAIGILAPFTTSLSLQFTVAFAGILLIGPIVLRITWTRPEWVFVLFVLALPFDNQNFLGISVSDLLLVCLFVRVVFSFRFRGPINDIIYIWLALAVFALIFSLLDSINPNISTRPTFTAIAMLTIPIVALNLGPRLDPTQVAKFILISSAIISLSALLQLLAHQLGYTLWYHHATSSRDLRFQVFRVVGPYVNPNHLAYFLLPCVVLALYFPFQSRKWRAIGLLDLVIICLTFTRSYILLALIFVLARFFGSIRDRHKPLLVSGIILAVIAFWPLESEIINYVRDFNPVSVERRFSFLRLGMQTFIDNLVTGIGLGNFRYVIESQIGVDRPAHNTFLQVAIGLGSLGLLAFGGLVTTVFLMAWQQTKELDTHTSERRFFKAFLMSSSAAVMASLFLDVLTLKNFWLWLGLLAAKMCRPVDTSLIKHADERIIH